MIAVHAWEHRQTDQVDLLYVVMEHGDADLGVILEEHRQEGNLSINKIRFFWEEILKCVAAVHHKNIIHLDLKPENFLMVSGVLKVIDFGLAHRKASSANEILYKSAELKCNLLMTFLQLAEFVILCQDYQCQ